MPRARTVAPRKPARTSVRRRPKNAPVAVKARAALDVLLTRQFGGFLMVMLAVITLFSVIGPVESFSIWWQDLFWGLFGWISPLALIGLLAGGFLLALSTPSISGKMRARWQAITGIVMAFLALMAMMSIVSPEAGSGGGLLGVGVGFVFYHFIGNVGGFLVLLLLGAIAILWGYKVPPRRLFQGAQGIGGGAKALSQRRQAVISEAPAPPAPRFPPVVLPGRSKREPAEPELESGEEEEEPEDVLVVREEPAAALAKGGYEVSSPLRRNESGELEWMTPPVDLMDSVAALEPNEREVRKKAQMIEETLASFGVQAKVTEISQGPAVTQFGVEPGYNVKTKEIRDREKRVIRVDEVSRTRVKVARITSLANDLALALSAPSIRIQAPVPGRSVVGIEVPNTSISTVGLRGVIESIPFQRMVAKSKLALALGRGVDGESIAADLTKMPHLLIAGATGSGKSVCLNSTIACLLMHTTPDEVRLLLVDPKRVEMAPFRGIPHLWTPVVMETDEVVRVLKMVTHEMDERYKKFAHAGARNIEAYNKRPLDKPLPYLVVVIDELADLMMMAPDDVERTICRLAQLARATGIHLIVATQRPSVDVVTGLIKANFPTRIAFAVSSQVDSRTILDMAGAEKLLGRGDMLFMSSDASKPVRLQGSYVSDAEIERIVTFWKGIKGPQYVWEKNQIANWSEESSAADDPLLAAARKLAQDNVRISPSLLQRRLHIGFPRAAQLMEQLQNEGLYRPPETPDRDEIFREEVEEEEEE